MVDGDDTALYNLYRNFSSIPTISGARFHPPTLNPISQLIGIGVELNVSQRDFVRKANRKFVTNLIVTEGGVDVGKQINLVDDTSVGSATSPGGKFKVVLRSFGDDPNYLGRRGLYVDIFHTGVQAHTLDVTSTHGEFYLDGTFGCLGFNSSETLVVYTAERSVETNGCARGKVKGEPWLTIDDEAYDVQLGWGETFSNKRRPALFILNLARLFDPQKGWLPVYAVKVEDVVRPIPFIVGVGEPGFDPGQACFSLREDDVVYFTGYTKTPRKHGLAYCQNRPSRIYRVRVDGTGLQAVTGASVSSRSPRFLEGPGEFIYYLQCALGGAHASCSRLCKFSLDTRQETVLVDYVSEHASSDQFPGLYTDQLGERALRVGGETYGMLSSVWRSHKVLLAVHTRGSASGSASSPQWFVVSEALGRADSVWSLLDVAENFILASRSQPNLPSELGPLRVLEIPVGWRWFGEAFTSSSQITVIPGHHLNLGLAVDGYPVGELGWEVYNHPERDPRLECILIKAIRPHRGKGGNSLVINIHGGLIPANTVGWNWLNACLAWLGFDVLHVNYTGSVGYGSDYVNKLVGRIGDLDVKDCQYAVGKAWDKGEYLRRFAMGGSHGGFLTAHLIGRYPVDYAASMLRNPVINVGAMTFTSDIPDWCFSEAGLSYDFNALRLTSPDEYATLYNASPLQYVDSLRTPILLLLGLDDRRVPRPRACSGTIRLRLVTPA
ncbi:hypothetical protein L0F63_000759 [Massospora cicadina]|nr:hypothetical protein L0F63_000759 [Massospora cicadina]